MDINDPRRRLQVLNNANPSLRVSVAPQPKVSVAQPKQRLFVGNTEIAPSASASTRPVQIPQARPRPTSTFDKVSSFSDTAADKIGGGLGRGFLRSIDFVLPGKNTFNLEGTANEWDRRAQASAAQQADQAYARAGAKFGSVVKGAADVGTLVAGAGVAEKAASKLPFLARTVDRLSQGGKISRATGKALSLLPGSLGGSATDVLQTAGRGDEQNVAKSFGIGTAVDLGIPVVGKGLKKGFNLFKGKGSKSFSIVEDLVGETDPTNIQKVLGVDNDLASYLAQETNPQTVESILRQLEVDPNIQLPDDVRKRLQEEGISSVRQKDSEYGAEYDPATKSINVRDQDAASIDNIYHELGHHVYVNKLTPEEKALFANVKGRASQEATGRAGYQADDFASEDFSDFMRLALTGRLREVPEEVRPIIQKYAKIAAQEAENAGVALPQSVAAETPSPFVKAEANKELVDQGFITGKIDNVKLNDLKLGTDTVGDIDVNQVAKYIEDLSNGKPIEPVIVQRGPNGELLVQDGKHRLEALKALGIEDVPVTEKAVKQADEVQQAVTEAAPLQSGVADAAPIKTADDVIEGTGENVATIGETVNKNADEAARFSEFEPEVQAQLNKIMEELPNAQKGYDDAAKVRSQEKADRIAKGNSAYEAAGGGEAGVRAKMGALKGEYSKSGFNPVQADEATQSTILNTIEKSGLRDFEKLNTQNAMRKIWGTAEGKPTTSDINYIRKFFGDDLADSVEQAVEEGTEKTWRDVLSNVAGIPRAAMSTLDFSMGGRQGAPVAVRNLKEWANANKESVLYATDSKKFDKAMKDIQGDDAYELMVDKMGIRFPGINKEAMEGDFISSDYIEKIPVYGSKGVAGSRRAYDGGLTKLRYNIAKKWVDDFGGVDTFRKQFSDKEMRDLGEVINTFTGSGGKKGGLLDQHMKTLSNTLFAPRFWAANLNRLNPVFYARLSPVARKEALKYQASFYSLAGSVLALASAAGATVIWDPRSADFAKIKVGNTRYDILGGQQQNIRLAAQLATGQKVDSSTGELRDLGEGFVPTRKEIVSDTFEGKANPLLGFAMRIADLDENSENKYGEHVNPLTEAGKLLIPLNFQSIADTTKDTGSLAKGVGMNIPGFVGFSTQTYGNVATKDQGKDDSGKTVFKGKVTEDMVTDDGGKVITDEKGRPIRVKFTGKESAIEKQAMIDDKRKAALTSQYKRSLSKDDQALLKLDKETRQRYLEEGKITQDQMDNLDRYEQQVKNLDGNSLPKGAKSEVAKGFFQKFKTMTKKDQDYWLKEPADKNSQEITKLLNKERAEGLSEFKPSNALAKAYAEYEDDINSHPEYTELDRREKAREFQKFAYKLNYSDQQRDIYSSNIGDIRYLIDEKQVGKEDLDAAIKLDDEMYNSGLISELKFSKKFRKDYGYGLPTGGGKNENLARGGSGGGGDSTPRTYISELLPSFKTASQGGDKPQFSSKRRTAGLSFKSVSTPSKGGKKVSIKL